MIGSEWELENILVDNPWLIEPNFQYIERQRKTKAGPIDIFGKDASGRYVVVELKINKASDVVVGQITRYMGAIKKEFNLSKEQVRGIIICEKMSDKLAFASEMIVNANVTVIEFITHDINIILGDLISLIKENRALDKENQALIDKNQELDEKLFKIRMDPLALLKSRPNKSSIKDSDPIRKSKKLCNVIYTGCSEGVSFLVAR